MKLIYKMPIIIRDIYDIIEIGLIFRKLIDYVEKYNSCIGTYNHKSIFRNIKDQLNKMMKYHSSYITNELIFPSKNTVIVSQNSKELIVRYDKMILLVEEDDGKLVLTNDLYQQIQGSAFNILSNDMTITYDF